MPFSKPLPTWNALGTKPPQSKIDAGWGADEKPPADWFNWIWNTTYQALLEVQQNALHTDRAGQTIAQLVTGKVPLAQLPDGTTTEKGILQLSSATNSTSTTLAATSSAVKAAYDLANGKYTKPASGIPKTDLDAVVQLSLGKADTALQSVADASTTVKGVVMLEDSTISTSITKAATPKSVKDALDWVKSFGLGDVAKDISGTDLNNLDATGIYKGVNLGNAPTTFSYFVFNLKSTDTSKYQTLYKISTNEIYTRINNNGTWTAWAKQVSLTADGILNLPNQSYVDINRSTSMSISSSVATKVTGFTEVTDRQNEHAADAITVKETGVYTIYAYTAWAAFTANRITTSLYINGASVGSISEHSSPTAATSYGINTIVRDLVAGDKLEFYVTQNNGTAQTMNQLRVRMIKNA